LRELLATPSQKSSVAKRAFRNFTYKPHYKKLVKVVKSKSTCSKWHFGQVGHKAKKTQGKGVFG